MARTLSPCSCRWHAAQPLPKSWLVDSVRGRWTKIFISYRRSDTRGHAQRIYSSLTERFGPDEVFVDIDSIPGGVDFLQHLEEVLSKTDVAIVLIGPAWRGPVEEFGRTRIDDPGDYVRLEVRTVLRSGMRVVPVLVDGVRLPRGEDLPDDLRALVRRQAVVFREGGEAGIRNLLDSLGQPTSDVEAEAITLSTDEPFVEGPQGAESIQLRRVPSGACRIPDGWDDNSPTTELHVSRFQISRFPITIAQYVVFITDPSGYSLAMWWDDAGQGSEHGPARDIVDTIRGNAMAPALVRRAEAIAFCRWLTRRAQTRLVIPSEAQWVRAAEGPDAFAFPWGNEFTTTACNTRYPELLDVVDAHPDGASGFGVEDLVGNAPEWVVLEHRSDLEFDETRLFHIRGCRRANSDPQMYTCKYRGESMPPDPSERAGFRVATLSKYVEG